MHDYKAAMHALDAAAIELAGVRHDSRAVLLSARSDVLRRTDCAEVALRRFNLKMSGNLAEAADITGRLATALAQEVEQGGAEEDRIKKSIFRWCPCSAAWNRQA